MFEKREFLIKTGKRHIVGANCLPEGDGPFPTVIISHGLGETQRNSEKYAVEIAKQGIACMIFDFCGGSHSSRSSGSILDMSVFTEKEDLLSVAEEVTKQEWVDRTNLFLMGMSQGGMVSAMAATELKNRVRGMILLYPGFNIPDLARENNASRDKIPDQSEITGVTVGKVYYESVYELSTRKLISGYSGRVLIMHGTEDELVPMYYARQALKLYGGAELLEFPGCGHNFEGWAQKRACREAIAFIKEISGEGKRNG